MFLPLETRNDFPSTLAKRLPLAEEKVITELEILGRRYFLMLETITANECSGTL